MDRHTSVVTYHRLTQGEQRLEQRVERRERVLLAVLALQPPPVEPDVPVRQLVDQVQQPRDDRVQPVRRHLLPDELDERLAAREDPAVHDVARHRRVRVVLEVDLARLAVERDLAEEEAERVEPGEEDAGDDLADALFAEAEVVAADDRRVHEVHSEIDQPRLRRDAYGQHNTLSRQRHTCR
jgi:hypothetical protein